MSSALVVGDDGVTRCPWGSGADDYRRYHDDEWGRPVSDESRLLEKLCLEGFQSGLSWLTILRKRPGFRDAFAGFDPVTVAAFGDDDVECLVQDARIVRHRKKIEAAIANARAVVQLHEDGLTLGALVWSHEPVPGSAPNGMDALPSATLESTALSRALRVWGFRFLGPTTVYAAMQSLGVVDDHIEGCEARYHCEAERAKFVRPQ